MMIMIMIIMMMTCCSTAPRPCRSWGDSLQLWSSPSPPLQSPQPPGPPGRRALPSHSSESRCWTWRRCSCRTWPLCPGTEPRRRSLLTPCPCSLSRYSNFLQTGGKQEIWGEQLRYGYILWTIFQKSQNFILFYQTYTHMPSYIPVDMLDVFI